MGEGREEEEGREEWGREKKEVLEINQPWAITFRSLGWNSSGKRASISSVLSASYTALFTKAVPAVINYCVFIYLNLKGEGEGREGKRKGRMVVSLVLVIITKDEKMKEEEEKEQTERVLSSSREKASEREAKCFSGNSEDRKRKQTTKNSSTAFLEGAFTNPSKSAKKQNKQKGKKKSEYLNFGSFSFFFFLLTPNFFHGERHRLLLFIVVCCCLLLFVVVCCCFVVFRSVKLSLPKREITKTSKNIFYLPSS